MLLMDWVVSGIIKIKYDMIHDGWILLRDCRLSKKKGGA